MPIFPEPALPSDVTRVAFADGTAVAGERALAVETAVNVVYGTVPYAVMMMSPQDLADFAIGFSLTEGIIEGCDEVRATQVELRPDGVRLEVSLVPGRLHALLARRRSMAGRTSCGVCGIEDLAALPRTRQQVPPSTRVAVGAIARALHALPRLQALNQATGAVHAAAWAALDGLILCVREDVGRHNALDKLVGALLTAGFDPA